MAEKEGMERKRKRSIWIRWGIRMESPTCFGEMKPRQASLHLQPGSRNLFIFRMLFICSSILNRIKPLFWDTYFSKIFFSHKLGNLTRKNYI